jgi:hypothetical protein
MSAGTIFEVIASRNLLVVIEPTAAVAVFSISASSKTMRGDFPPSSSETAFKFDFAAAIMMARPAPAEPVKLILLLKTKLVTSITIQRRTDLIFMCDESSAPVLPGPETTLMIPAGKPAWKANCASRMPWRGVSHMLALEVEVSLR